MFNSELDSALVFNKKKRYEMIILKIIIEFK